MPPSETATLCFIATARFVDSHGASCVAWLCACTQLRALFELIRRRSLGKPDDADLHEVGLRLASTRRAVVILRVRTQLAASCVTVFTLDAAAIAMGCGADPANLTCYLWRTQRSAGWLTVLRELYRQQPDENLLREIVQVVEVRLELR